MATGGPGGGIVDRSPFEAAEAVVRTVLAHRPDFGGEEGVWAAFLATRPASDREYFDTLRRTRHSLFYDHMQKLYEFARGSCTAAAENVCFESGRAYTDGWIDRNLHEVLRAALASPGEFQETIVGVLRETLYRETGGKYVLGADAGQDKIVLTLAHRLPDVMDDFLRSHGLDPDRAFGNAFRFIAGAMVQFAARIVRGFDASHVKLEVREGEGRFSLPVARTDGFAYETFVPRLIEIVERVEERQRSTLDDQRLESDLILHSPLMRETWDRIRRASRTDETVLLRGESGTGKSFIARKIHELSARRDRAFVEVGLTSDIGSDNMIQSDLFGHEKGAFTGATGRKQGLFSLADGGTIFLDEIGDATPELQAKLLRVLETSAFKRLGGLHDLQVDVRVIVATNRELESMVEEGAFRRDLYYRLNVIPIVLPPLRNRREDIQPLVEFLLARASARGKQPRKPLAPGLVERLCGYPWPGNIRELDHALKHASAMADAEIGPEHFPDAVRRWMEGAPGATPVVIPPAKMPTPRAVIDEEALRAAIRGSDAIAAGSDLRPHENPAHVDYAKRAYLAALIDEFQGDLSLIGRYWDRSAEKTIRKLVNAYGLAERLAAARACRRR